MKTQEQVKCTPGPWYAKNNQFQGLIVCETTGENIAVTYNPKYSALVAAAPELLNALYGLLSLADNENLYEEWKEEFKAAEEAIAKATE